MQDLVRCPHCEELSEVAPASLGQFVACPFCAQPFRAARLTFDAVRAEPPVVFPSRDRSALDLHEDAPPPEPLGLLWSCALLPVGIPILWMLGLFVLQLAPIFSFALPVAMAVGLGGVNLGIIFASGWSTSSKIKAVLAVGLLGLFTAASLFFLKKEWAEGLKKQLGPNNLNWQDYEPTDRAYRVKLPGRAQETVSPLAEWPLKAVRTAIEGRQARGLLGVIYTAAHGPTLPDLKDRPDDDCFEQVQAQLRELGEVASARPLQIPDPRGDRDYPGREWVLALPDGVTNRVVRVYRVRQRGEDQFFYLAVEGAFVTPDAKYVQDFLKAFALRPLPRR